jgi:hypothetical protein
MKKFGNYLLKVSTNSLMILCLQEGKVFNLFIHIAGSFSRSLSQ